MKKINNALMTLTLMITMSSILPAFSPATHMYLGSQTIEIWQYYDEEFYAWMTADDPYTLYDDLTKRFYYLGLTLPDMLDENWQETVRSVVNLLYEHRDYLGGALAVSGGINNSIANTMTFSGASAGFKPSHDIVHLEAMVQLMRNNPDADAFQKALIYGAYIHVIHDQFAHNIMQPSLFGYGFNLDKNLTGSLLHHPENYYELFTQTHIPATAEGWSFIADIYKGFIEVVNGSGYIDNNESTFDLFSVFGFNGVPIASYHTFEEYFEDFGVTNPSISAIESFIMAAEETGYITEGEIGYEQLKNYIYGWGIMNFFVYGYRADSPESDRGWFLRHTNWTPQLIVENTSEMVDPHINMDEWWEDIAYTFLSAVGHTLLDFFDTFFGEDGATIGLLSMIYIEDIPNPTQPWTWYWETSQGLSAISDLLPPMFDGVEQAYDVWEDNNGNNPKPTFERDTYSEELTKIQNFTPLLMEIMNGDLSLNHSNFTYSRKAGILGGIYNVDETREYFDQPGVIDLHFEDHLGLVYTETDVWPMPGMRNIDLVYDLVTFGKSWVSIQGDANSLPLSETIVTSADRFSDNLTVNAHEASQNSHTQLSFRIKTADIYNEAVFEKMLDSDYGDAYANVPDEVKPGEFGYDALFKGGITTREIGENPIENPKQFWPYVLPIQNALHSPQTEINFISLPNGTIEIQDGTYFDGSGYPNEFILLESDYYSVYPDQQEFYSLRAQAFTDNGDQTYSIFDKWVARDEAGEELLPYEIFNGGENSLETPVVFTADVASVEAECIEVTIIGDEVELIFENGNYLLEAPALYATVRLQSLLDTFAFELREYFDVSFCYSIYANQAV